MIPTNDINLVIVITIAWCQQHNCCNKIPKKRPKTAINTKQNSIDLKLHFLNLQLAIHSAVSSVQVVVVAVSVAVDVADTATVAVTEDVSCCGKFKSKQEFPVMKGSNFDFDFVFHQNC